MPTSLRGDSYHQYFSQKHWHNLDLSDNKKYDSLKIYLLIMLKVLIITVMIELISRDIFIAIVSLATNFYLNYDIWIFSIFIGVCMPQSIVTFCIIIIIYSQRSYRMKILFVHTIVSVTIIALIIHYGLLWHKYHSLPSIMYPTRYIDIIDSNIYEALMYIYYIPLNLATTLTILWSMNFIQQMVQKWKTLRNDNHIVIEFNAINHNQLHIPLSVDFNDVDSNINDEEEEQTKLTDIISRKHIILWILLIVFLLILTYSQWYFRWLNADILWKHYEEIIRYWIIWCIILKWILKYIAHLFDSIRIKMNNNSIHRLDCDVSLEVIFEIWLSIMYWCIFRVYVIKKPPEWELFAIAKIAHMFSEIVTCLKMSKLYYEISSKFMQYMTNKTWHRWPITIFISNDKCEYVEWNNRCSIDIGIRFIVALSSSIYLYQALCTLYFFRETIGYPKKYWLYSSYYTIISSMTEIVFYLAMYLWYKRLYNINIFKAFNILYYECGRKHIYTITSFAILTYYSFV